jgi:PAS domain S-box-containing protein
VKPAAALATEGNWMRTQSEPAPGLRAAGMCTTPGRWCDGLFALAGDAILVHDLAGRFMELNPAAGRMLGYTREELLELREWEIVTNASRAESVKLWSALQPRVPVAVERTYRCKDGSLVVADTRLTRFDSDGRDWVMVSCRDVTARKRLEDKLRASEQLARGQVEALKQALDALAEESALDKLLGRILGVMSRRMGAAGVSLWLKDETTALPVFRLSFEQGKLCTRPEANHPVRENPAYWQENPIGRELLRTKQPVVCADVKQDARVGAQRQYLIAQGIRTVLAVPLLLAGQVIGLVSIRSARPRKYRAEEIELAQALAHQATLAIQLTRLAEESRQAAVLHERNRMARDIHDTLAQGFTGIILQLEAAAEATLRGDAISSAKHLRRVSKLARDSLAEARRSVQALRPQALQAGSLAAALDGLITQVTPGSGLRAELSCGGQQRPLPPEVEEALLRIGQEALTNTLKHARADRFRMRLVFAPGEVRLEASDNGCGFEPAQAKGGFGLTGMTERVSSLSGQLTIESHLGQGTSIAATLPVNATWEAAAA